jgi:hypothetical protein
MKAVAELDDQYPYVFRRGEQELAEVLCIMSGTLMLLASQFRQAVNHERDFAPEETLDVCDAGRSVFARVVEYAGHDRRGTHAELAEHLRRLEKVCSIRFTRTAILSSVRGLSERPRVPYILDGFGVSSQPRRDQFFDVGFGVDDRDHIISCPF